MQHQAAIGHADAVEVAAMKRVIGFHALLFIHVSLCQNPNLPANITPSNTHSFADLIKTLPEKTSSLQQTGYL